MILTGIFRGVIVRLWRREGGGGRRLAGGARLLRKGFVLCFVFRFEPLLGVGDQSLSSEGESEREQGDECVDGDGERGGDGGHLLDPCQGKRSP